MLLEVAHALMLTIEQMTPKQNGKFYSLAGQSASCMGDNWYSSLPSAE